MKGVPEARVRTLNPMRIALASLSAAVVMVLSAVASPALAYEGQADGQPASYSASYQESEPCEQLRHEIEERIAQLNVDHQGRREAFYKQQHAESSEYFASDRSESDRDGFYARQRAAAEEFEAKLSAEYESALKAQWERYDSECAARAESAQAIGGSGQDVPACEGKWDALSGVMEELRVRWEPKFRAIESEFNQARSSGEGVDWEGFEARMRALFVEIQDDAKGLMDEAGVRECFDATGGFSMMEGEFLSHVKSLPSGRSEGYGKAMPAEGAESEIEIRARKVWESECMPRIQAILKEAQSRRDQADTWESPEGSTAPRAYESSEPSSGMTTRYDGYGGSASGPGTTWSAEDLPEELRLIIKEIAHECEKRIRALFEEHMGAQDSRKDGFNSLQMYWDEENQQIVVKGACISMVGLPEEQMMTHIAVGGVEVIDRLYANGFLNFMPEETDQGTAIMVYDNDKHRILAVHDNCRGVINIASSDLIGSVTLDLADALTLERTSEGIRWSGADAHGAVLVHAGSVEIGDGNVLTLAGHATFLVANKDAADKVKDRHGKDVGDALTEARLSKKVGAEVTINADGEADPVPYGDMVVQLDEAAKGRFSARVESEEGTGKTVVFRVDSGLIDCQALRVVVAAVASDGTESGIEVHEAESLEDVLEPADDGETVEWWLVQDKNGCQIMVSFPHFSEKKVTIESAGIDVGSLVPGFEASALFAIVGAVLVGVGVRRRKA